MNILKKSIILVSGVLMSTFMMNAQNYTPSFNVLNSIPDAKSMSLAGASVATSADAYSVFKNPSAILLSGSTMQIGASYSPWRPRLSNEFALYSVAAYYKIIPQLGISVGAKMQRNPKVMSDYFYKKMVNSYEGAIDVALSFSPFKNFALSAGASYARMCVGKDASWRIPVSLGAMYKCDFIEGSNPMYLNIGLVAKNLNFYPRSSKSYMFLPSYLGAGLAYDVTFADYHRIGLTAETRYDLLIYKNFSFSENFGLEYTAFDILSLRFGYRLADKRIRDYSYFTAGLGVKYFGVGLDCAYVIASENTPMQNAWWLTLSFDLNFNRK